MSNTLIATDEACSHLDALSTKGQCRHQPEGAAEGHPAQRGGAGRIETKGLRASLGRTFQVRDMDMHVPHRSVYGFLGPNGAGKTTTIRLLLGLLKPQAGHITVLGQPMPQSYASVLARTGYVPERPHVYPSLTVEEAIRLHSAFYATWDQKWADELQAKFSLEGAQRVSVLSKGESGKLLMLLALSQRPDLLVLDEPTDGLDPVVRDYDPHTALDGGADGLAIIRDIVSRAPAHIRAGGLFGLEVGMGQARIVAGLARDAGLDQITVVKDLSGIERCVFAHKGTSPGLD